MHDSSEILGIMYGAVRLCRLDGTLLVFTVVSDQYWMTPPYVLQFFV